MASVIFSHKRDKTMFLAWFDCCEHYPEARLLTYAEMPTMFIYDAKGKVWNKRKKVLLLGDCNMFRQALDSFII